jgi:hypothetical protein
MLLKDNGEQRKNSLSPSSNIVHVVIYNLNAAQRSGLTTISTESSRCFPHFLQSNSGIVPWIIYDYWFPYIF